MGGVARLHEASREVRTKASTAHPSISSARTARTYYLNAHDDPNEQNVAVLFDDFV